MASTEEHDRITRFRRLADLQGVTPPQVEEIILPPGSVDFMTGPVPVIRVVFAERAFFDFNSSTPLSSAEPIFDLIAENMKRDVPDAALTVLGHTDAIGTDQYNLDLSRRRAQAVMQALAERGVSTSQMSEVAIGKRQPIAPNNTDQGRALNRRVEFLISPALGANLAAVHQRAVQLAYLSVDDAAKQPISPDKSHYATVAQVYRLDPSPGRGADASIDQSTLRSIGGLPLDPPVVPETTQQAAVAESQIAQAPEQQAQLAPVKPPVPVELIPPGDVQMRELGTSVKY